MQTSIIHQLFFAFWFFLPAGIANMAPVIGTRIPGIKKWIAPIDGYRTWNNMRILGDHKTWRGILCGTVAGTIFCLFQFGILSRIPWLQNIAVPRYEQLSPLLLGFALSLGALTGDAIKSVIKRQLNIPSGTSFFPFDQIDYIAGALLFSLPFIRLFLIQYVFLFFLYILLHLIVSYIGYLLKLKKTSL